MYIGTQFLNGKSGHMIDKARVDRLVEGLDLNQLQKEKLTERPVEGTKDLVEQNFGDKVTEWVEVLENAGVKIQTRPDRNRAKVKKPTSNL